MKLSVAQSKPFPGQIAKNIFRHVEMIEVAIDHHVELIVFSELSITGYEPTLVDKLALDVNDKRFDVFQQLSDRGNITIGIGAPIKSSEGIQISLIFFRPGLMQLVYSKHYLHTDEDPFFVSGQNIDGIVINGAKIALAICYEISIAQHTALALQTGATCFIASVAKSFKGVGAATQQLVATAKTYGVPVLMSNAVGPSDGGVCAGQSLVVDAQGSILAQMDSETEGLLIFDGRSVESVSC